VGLYEGISGVLYFLARAKIAGYDINTCQQSYEKGWEYIQRNLREQTNTSPGFYGGKAGIALTFSQWMDAGLFSADEPNRVMLKTWLQSETNDLNVAAGIAGQGLVALQARKYLPAQFISNLVTQHIEQLSKSRQKDGQWVIIYTSDHKKQLATSILYGNSGILLYLLNLGYQMGNTEAYDIGACALERTNDLAKKMANSLKFRGFRRVLVDAPTGDTLTGMVLVLLKAFEIFKNQKYKQSVENILLNIPELLVHENFNQDSGMAGLGELYLQAYKVLHEPIWLKRAGWVAQFIVNTAGIGSEGTHHWLSNNAIYPTADFMVGSTGILHFLIRYLAQDKVGYRLFE
jgi:lantibiotic modifying enzyme